MPANKCQKMTGPYTHADISKGIYNRLLSDGKTVWGQISDQNGLDLQAGEIWLAYCGRGVITQPLTGVDGLELNWTELR